MSSDRVIALVNHLRGTCEDMSAAGERLKLFDEFPYDATEAEVAYFDNEIFMCDECNWWFDQEEMSEKSWVCRECNPDV